MDRSQEHPLFTIIPRELSEIKIGENKLQFSTNLPGVNSREPRKMNVSPEADAAFMRDLQRNDPERYRRLTDNIQKRYFAAQELDVSVSYCGNERDGNHLLPADARSNTKYCDRACQNTAYRVRQTQKIA